MTYKHLIEWQLRCGESLDVYLAELNRFAFLLGGMGDRMLACAFVHELSGNVKRALSVLSRMDAQSIDQLLAGRL